MNSAQEAPARVTVPMMECVLFDVSQLINILIQAKLTPEQDRIVHQAIMACDDLRDTRRDMTWSNFDDPLRRTPKWFSFAHQKLTNICNVLLVMHGELVAMGTTTRMVTTTQRGCKRSAYDAFNE
jgi:hypothetical protein